MGCGLSLWTACLSLDPEEVVIDPGIQVIGWTDLDQVRIVPRTNFGVDCDELHVQLVHELKPFQNVRGDQVVVTGIVADLESGPIVVAQVRGAWDEFPLSCKVVFPKVGPVFRQAKSNSGIHDSEERIELMGELNVRVQTYLKSIHPETSWSLWLTIRM